MIASASPEAPAATPASPLTIAFFGLGAVGSSMLICLSELAEREDVLLRFVVVARNGNLARDALFHAERLFDRIDFVGLPDFARLFDGQRPGAGVADGRPGAGECGAPRLQPPAAGVGPSPGGPSG